VPGNRNLLYLSYTPKFLRVSIGTSYHTNPTLLYDTRYVTDFGFWSSTTAAIPTDRYTFVYGAGSNGSGQATRPFTETMRFGIRVPTAIATNADGSLQAGFSVSGNSAPF